VAESVSGIWSIAILINYVLLFMIDLARPSGTLGVARVVEGAKFVCRYSPKSAPWTVNRH